MKSISHLRFSIIGAHAFGKTNLIASLIRVAATSKGNVSCAERSGKAIEMMQQILDGGYNLAGTDWTGIKNFQFSFVKTGDSKGCNSQEKPSGENRKWDISFTDYPGAIFQKFLNDSKNIPAANKPEASSGPEKNNVTLGAQTTKLAEQLLHSMESVDGLIILLPRNYHVHDEILRVYRTRLDNFLAKALGKRPNLPVCLAINKWDWFDEPECRVEEFLSKDEVVSDIIYAVQNRCKNFFYIAISAFGKHEENDKQKWDKKSKPQNVLKMFFELSERAEANRIEEMATGWEKSSGWAKTFIWPWKALSACHRGFTLAADREKAVSVYRKACGRFIGACAGLAFAGFFIWAGGEAHHEYRRFSAANVELTAYEGNQFPNLDTNKLSRMKDSLTFCSWVDRLILTKETRESLVSRRDVLEERFNEYVYTNLLATLENDGYRDKGPWELSTTQREARAKDRLAKIKDEKGRLTDNATQSQAFNDLGAKEDLLLKQLNESRSFYDDIFEKLKRPGEVSETDWLHSTPRIVRGIQDQHKEKQISNAEDWKKLDALLAEAENTSSNELAIALSKVDNNYPGGDWRSEVARTAGKTNEIAIAREWFAENSPVFIFFDAQGADWAATNSHWKLYGPFDDELEKLNRQSDIGKIQAIVQFLGHHTVKEFPDRSKEIEGVAAERKDRISKVMEGFHGSIEKIKDAGNEPYEVRVSKANQRKGIAAIALKELPERGDEYQEVASVRDDAEKFVKDYSQDVVFEKLAKHELERGTILSIWKVLRDQDWKEKAAYATYSPQLKERVVALEKKRRDDLATMLSDPGLQDDLAAPMKERIRRKNLRIGLYERVLQDLAEDTDAYGNVNSEKEKECDWIAKHEHYQQFDVDLDALPQGDQRIRGITEFLARHDEKEFPEYGEKLKALRLNLAELESQRKADLDNALTEKTLQDDEEASMSTRINRKHQIIQKLDEALSIFAEGSSFYDATRKRKSDEETWIANHKHYIRFDENLAAVSDGEMRARDLEAFLKKHLRKDYPEYANSRSRLEIELEELEANAKTNIMNQLSESRENSKTMSWQTKVDAAVWRTNLLEKSKGTLPESSGKWLAHLIREEDELIDSLTKQGTFLDEYKMVMAYPTNQWLNKIHEFCEKYRREDYPAQTNEFANLDQRKTDAEEAFKREYASKVDELAHPSPREFAAWSIYHRTLADTAEEIQERCPTNSLLWVKFDSDARVARKASADFIKFAEVQDRAKIIEEAAKKDDVATRDVLMLVQLFQKDFSKTNDIYARPELYEEHKKVEDIGTGKELEWEKELNEIMSDSDQDGKLEWLNKYLPVFIHGSVLHGIYEGKKKNLETQMDIQKRQEAYIKAATDCLKRIDGASSDTTIMEIDVFFREHGENDLGSPKAKTLIAQLRAKRMSAVRDKTWQEVSARVATLESRISHTENEKELQRLKGECAKEKDFLKHLDYSRKQSLIVKLDDLIHKIEVEIGDGSFKRIQDAETAYKEHPSEERCRELQKCLNSFDASLPGNIDKEEIVKTIRSNLNNDKKLLDEVKRKLSAFYQEKTLNAAKAFQEAVNQFVKFNQEYKANHDEIAKCNAYLNQIGIGLGPHGTSQVHAQLIGYDLTNRKDTHMKKRTIELCLGEKDCKMKFNASKPRQNEQTLDKPSSGNYGFDAVVPASTWTIEMTVRFYIERKAFHEDKKENGSFQILYAKILARGMRTGTCEYSVETNECKFFFRFTNIPTITLE